MSENFNKGTWWNEIELLKANINKLEQEKDELLNAIENLLNAPRLKGHALAHPDPKAEARAWRTLSEVYKQLRQKAQESVNENTKSVKR